MKGSEKYLNYFYKQSKSVPKDWLTLKSHGHDGLSLPSVAVSGGGYRFKGEQMTLLLLIMILANILVIWWLIEAVYYLLDRDDMIDVLLEMRREKDDD